MDYEIEEVENKHLLVLVHGLNGSDASWKGEEKRLVENLVQEDLIKNNFNVAIFSYRTKIFEINWFKRIISLFLGFIKVKPKEDAIGFNVGINPISQDFESEIRNIYNNYETISIIAHSMGGLVVKSSFTWMREEILKKIQLFISLSVPHIGSSLAQLGDSLLGDNPQLKDLRLIADFTTQINQRYADLRYKPKIVYQSGNQDTVVPRQSAIPPNVPTDSTISTSDNHFSVLLFKDRRNNLIFETILKELKIVLQPFGSVEVGIDDQTPFGFFVDAVASSLNIKVDKSCFSLEELKTPLREGNISGNSVEEFFTKVGDFSINKLPEYTVKKDGRTLNYIFIKT
ncbi:lipase family alpha/beta hydrolase [Spirosoma fluviale]|uniref:Serine esterase n=1 Tax=Spirosoma fluviale TaxID=1597977 RepID=A0A286FE09_9BACT|nr:hypothetical protein [Spirosoma fluviale]SOD81064.1 Putative serine esterase [Spirosoma fluviale]